MKQTMSHHLLSFRLILAFWLLLLAAACNSPYTSKKRGYYHIELPADHAYRVFERPGFPYSFEYPVYAEIVQDSTYFDNTPENPYWINIDLEKYKGRIFLSYKQIGGSAIFKRKMADGSYRDSMGINIFDNLISDAFRLTAKNDVIASSIRDSFFITPNNIQGVYFRVGGNAATARQFFLTDSTRHFLRGALYFESSPNADSLRPLVDFFSVDLEHMINTFRWKAQ